jgi:hypothetical protein
MKTSTRISWAGWWIITAAAALLLSGCGSSDSGPVAHHAKKKVAQQSIDPGSRSPDDMVAAVSASKAGPPVTLKFELRQSPQIGQPVDIDIAVLPEGAAIERVYGKFQTGEDLDLVSGGELESVEKPGPGSVIRHVLQVIPKQDGIFTVSATVAVEIADSSITRTFLIPMIVGAGLADEQSPASPKAH